MSPAPLNVVETERVQGPLTSSATCTSPGAPNWPNHPTSRSPARTGSDRVRVYDVKRVSNEAATPWTNWGDAAGVVTVGGPAGPEGSLRGRRPSPAYWYLFPGAASPSSKFVLWGGVVPRSEPSGARGGP